ncbi:MAG: peptidyl-prolyl cis-trans isomerase [Candidatus Riflebacteria bacterium]|nr:peptidyl-prolyl cis-trans isomerase [Candidatus Riflebacteria bacterium]
MSALKSLIARVNAILLLVIISLVIGLITLGVRGEKVHFQSENHLNYAAELLAHGLYNDAVLALQQAVENEPVLEKCLKIRKSISEIYMNYLGDYEKALAELIYIKSHSPAMAVDAENGIKICMNRLGRVYDVQRRMLLEEGKNPIVSEVSSLTVIKLGNESACTIEQLEQQLAQRGLPLKSPPKEALSRVIQQVAGEMLFKRAAKRAGVAKRQSFVDRIRQMEENLILQIYLEEEVLKDIKVDEQALKLYLEKHAEEFDSPMRIVFSTFSFKDETSARDWLKNPTGASQPEVLSDHSNVTVDKLPTFLKSIKWNSEVPKDPLGPIEISGKWFVYQINEVIPERKVPPDLAKKQAQLRLLEEKQGSKISDAISELAKKEELKILDDVVASHFYPGEKEAASGTKKLPDAIGTNE